MFKDTPRIFAHKGNYFPVINPMNKYEDHCVHFGQWVAKNKIS
jgi:hypothetical protein